MYRFLVILFLSWSGNSGSCDSSWSNEMQFPGAVTVYMVPVFPLCSIGAWLWLRRCILLNWVNFFLASWGLSLKGLRYWYFLRVSVPACYAILGVPIGGVLLPGFIGRTQWRVWYTEVYPSSFPLSWWGYPCYFYSSFCWFLLVLPHPCCLEELCMVPGIICDDPILDGGGPPWW